MPEHIGTWTVTTPHGASLTVPDATCDIDGGVAIFTDDSGGILMALSPAAWISITPADEPASLAGS